MKETDYIKCVKKNLHYGNKEIKEDLEECKRIAVEKGVNIEKVYELRASAFDSLKVKTIQLDGSEFMGPRDKE